MSLAKNISAFLKDRFSLLSVFGGAVLNAYALVLVLNLALGLLLIARDTPRAGAVFCGVCDLRRDDTFFRALRA